MSNNTLEKIAKLLNQAENAGTEEEAATFMDKAQSLATLYSVDLAKARHATIAKERTVPVQRTINIGERRTKGLRTLVDLYLGIAAANDIKVTIAHDATRVYGVGFEEDFNVAEALYASLLTQQARAADDFKRNGEWRNEKVWVENKSSWYGGGEYKPQSWLTARLNFQDAFASRIRSRLYEAKWAEEDRIKKAEAEAAKRPHLDADGTVTAEFNQWLIDNHGIDLDDLADDTGTNIELAEMLRDVENEWTQEILAEYKAALEAQSNGSAGAELVLVEKRKAVREVAEATILKRARGSYRGGTSGASSSSGQRAGRAAGDRASLGRGTAIGGTRGAISA